MLVTVAARAMSLQPGSVAILYMMVVVFASLRAGFFTSFAISIGAVACCVTISFPYGQRIKQPWNNISVSRRWVRDSTRRAAVLATLKPGQGRGGIPFALVVPFGVVMLDELGQHPAQ